LIKIIFTLKGMLKACRRQMETGTTAALIRFQTALPRVNPETRAFRPSMLSREVPIQHLSERLEYFYRTRLIGEAQHLVKTTLARVANSGTIGVHTSSGVSD
jgi:hypothetical protein